MNCTSWGDITEEEVRDIVKNAHFDGQKVITLADMLLAPIEDEEHKIHRNPGNRSGVSPEYVQVQMMEIYIRQISSALHNSQLHRLVSTKNEELTKAYEQLNESYVEIINAMRTIVDERDIYTRGHSDRVSAIAADIAGQMKKDKHTIERIRLAGLFHDIGKVGISDKILLKAGQAERRGICEHQKHSGKGAKSFPP